MRLLLSVLLVAGVAAAGEDDLLRRALEVQERFRSTVEKVRPAVVSLQVTGPPREKGGKPRHGSGSGVVIDSRGLILTNHHVAGWAEQITVILSGTRQVRASIRGRDPGGDLLLLELSEPGPWPAVDLAEDHAVQPGSWVLAMGNPRGEAHDGRATVTWGAVTALHCLGGEGEKGTQFYGDAIQTDAEINPGNSGGPLFDLDGRLVGINGRIASSVKTSSGAVNASVGWAIPASQIRRFLPLLEKGGTVKHGFLGLRVEGEPGGHPSVTAVRPGSTALRAGIRAGDVLLSLDGEAVVSPARLTNLVSSRPAGLRVTLRIRREGEEREIVLLLDERPGDGS